MLDILGLRAEGGPKSASQGWQTMLYAGNRCAPRRSISLVVLGICLVGAGCQDVATTWSTEATSPDGRWVAVARSQQWGGPGTAYDATTVYLRLTKSGQHPIVDFLFPDPFCQRQVLVFSQEYATINLTMKWVSPTHLDVAYGPSSRPGDQVSIVFQVVKCAGVDISVRELSSDTTR